MYGILVCGDVPKSISVSERLKLFSPTAIPFDGNCVVVPTDATTTITYHSKEHEAKPPEHTNGINQNEFGQRAPHTQRKMKQNN